MRLTRLRPQLLLLIIALGWLGTLAGLKEQWEVMSIAITGLVAYGKDLIQDKEDNGG